MTGDTVRL